MKRLPIGIQSIEKILGKGAYVYVDKTQFALELIEGDAPHYFLSRPRRFGKSLFVSTLREISKGNKELFKECHIYNSHYEWQPHPVPYFDFGKIANTTTEKLEAHLSAMLVRMGSLQGDTCVITCASVKQKLQARSIMPVKGAIAQAKNQSTYLMIQSSHVQNSSSDARPGVAIRWSLTSRRHCTG